jgi:uncharacterized membrane protein
MVPKLFHERIDKARLTAALADAERKTRGRIYVYVTHRPVEEPLEAAWQRFARLGLSRIHDHRASVLIYIAPKTHKFAIVGDTAIHERCGEEYWKQLAEILGLDLKKGDITAALLNTIASLGKTLAEHFPPVGSASH